MVMKMNFDSIHLKSRCFFVFVFVFLSRNKHVDGCSCGRV